MTQQVARWKTNLFYFSFPKTRTLSLFHSRLGSPSTEDSAIGLSMWLQYIFECRSGETHVRTPDELDWNWPNVRTVAKTKTNRLSKSAGQRQSFSPPSCAFAGYFSRVPQITGMHVAPAGALIFMKS